MLRLVRSGSIAGAVSALLFTAVHDVLISDIWFSVVPMVISGAVCGLCVAWSYARVTESPSVRSWTGFNLVYVCMFGVLGAISVAIFEPKTTVAALIAANEAPTELILDAAPLTIAFTLAAAVVLGWRHARRPGDYGIILLTTGVLVVLLGLNVSVLGFVAIPLGAVYLVLEMFGLIAVINILYVLGFAALERRYLAPIPEAGS